jgi:hypothetical protein
VTAKPSSRPYAARLWDRVPVWTRVRDQQADGLLAALLSALGVGLDAVQADVLRLLDDMFVDTCDPRLIPLIGDLVGVQVDREIPLARQRHQVKYALHLRRRRGTIEAIETLCWQRTGFRATVTEPRRTPASPGRARTAMISGAAPAAPLATVAVSARGAADLQVALDVARPVQRRQVQLALLHAGSDVHAIAPGSAVAMRRSDGTPIFRTDDPAALVGPGLAIELLLDGGDFPVLGELVPRFMNLAGDTATYVPSRTIAIDPELGRAVGPTPPQAGLRARRRYRLRFWQARGGEAIYNQPAAKATTGDGSVYTFAADGSTTGLTDDDGNALRLAIEGQGGPPVPRPDERLIIALQVPRALQAPRARRPAPAAAFALLPPGQPYTPALPAIDHPGALALDTWGLARLFSVEDAWGWERYPTVRLVRGFAPEPPPDGTVEIDVERGRLRIGPQLDPPALHVRYFRRYDLAAAKRTSELTVTTSTPLGRTARVTFKDTDSMPGGS